MKLPATEYRLSYFIVGRIGRGIWQVDVGSVQPDPVCRGPRAYRAESPSRGHIAGPRSSCALFADLNAAAASGGGSILVAA
jgi:hypothetical protein